MTATFLYQLCIQFILYLVLVAQYLKNPDSQVSMIVF